MAKRSAAAEPLQNRRKHNVFKGSKGGTPPAGLRGMLWRVDRLERQVQRLSELVRQHAADADRLVQIVAEDREILWQELQEPHSNSSSDPQPAGPTDPKKFGIFSS